jgi:hypothetical protein
MLISGENLELYILLPFNLLFMLNQTTSRLSPFCFLVLCVTFAGCGGEPKPDGLPTLYQVSLTFTQDGEPCVDVNVPLIPLDGSPWGVGGKTNEKGVATFITHGKFSGVPAGKYRVEVSKYETEIDSKGDPLLYTLIDPALPPIEIEITGKDKFEPFDLGKKVRELVKP